MMGFPVYFTFCKSKVKADIILLSCLCTLHWPYWQKNVKMCIFTEENIVPAQADIGRFCNKVFVSFSVLNHTLMSSNNKIILFC